MMIPPQSGLGKVSFTNGIDPVTGFEDITFEFNVNNIAYSWSGFLCGSGSDTNGTYTGEAKFTSPEGDLTIVE